MIIYRLEEEWESIPTSARCFSIPPCMKQKELCRYSDELRTKQPGFDSRRGKIFFLFSAVSNPDLGTTQTPIQWVSVGAEQTYI
jgi:hypothetical protein